MMEWRIAQSGCITYSGDLMHPPDDEKKPKTSQKQKPKTIRGRDSDNSDEDD